MTDTPTPTPAGKWKIVPMEPTIGMKQAGYIAWCDADKTQVYGEAIADRCYGAMLAAAPVATPTSADVIEGMRWQPIESAPKDREWSADLPFERSEGPANCVCG